MTFPGLTKYLTGVLVPVSALRTGASLGIGEFADLPPLAGWCAEVGLDLIQILPVNDTGWQPSPYSALSAFALHPLYLRVESLPEYESLPPADREDVDAAIGALRAAHGEAPRIDYSAVLDAKSAVERLIYDRCARDEAMQSAVRDFVSRHPWVREYAAYKVIKAEQAGAAWQQWTEFRDPTPEALAIIWSDERRVPELTYHAWVQMRLDEQLRAASAAVADHGVLLKGDLPILINEDSVDTWACRRYFSTRLRAGAPPDAHSATGQNWGLPIYDWDELARDDYRWWKERLRQADRYYAAYRIDHVLGFFRVWSIPADDVTGYLGHFSPGAVATRERLNRAGLEHHRIRWLAEPHIPGNVLRENLGEESDAAIELALQQIEGEDLYLFGPGIRGERDIMTLDCSQAARDWLAEQYRDRALVRLEHDTFVPVWSFAACSRYGTLSDDERRGFSTLADELREESELLWEEQGRRLLTFMRDTTEMLPCAEDLGAIPDCVPGALADLGVLGLRIPRWARRWKEPGQPHIPPADYPFLTVCAPSVHDTSTMRGWWLEDDDRYGFWRSIGLTGEPPADYDPSTARLVTRCLLRTGSALCVFQIQDLLALVDRLVPEDPAHERVNTPGTVGDQNWSYRTTPLETLCAHDELREVLRALLDERRRRMEAP